MIENPPEIQDAELQEWLVELVNYFNSGNVEVQKLTVFGGADISNLTATGSSQNIINTSQELSEVSFLNNNVSNTTTYNLAANKTVGSGVVYNIQSGAIIDGAYTLTFDNASQIKAQPGQKVFGDSITVVFTNGGTVHPGWWGEAVSLNVNKAASSLSGGAGGVVELLSKTYTITTTITVPIGVSLKGTHTPNQANPADVKSNQGTIFNKTADVDAIVLEGTNRTTSRGGKNLITGIAFEVAEDASSEDIIYAKWADLVYIEKCSFWEDDDSTTVGHMINVEECWDWTLVDCVFKQYGNSGGTKHAINLYNGASNFTNYFYFRNCRFYNGKGKAVVSDAGGAGSTRNSYVFFQNCKFEDSDDAALSYISGPMSHVAITDSSFISGGGARHIDIDSQGDDWRIKGCEFDSIGDTATEYINVDGSQNVRIRGCYFSGIGSAITRFIHIDGTGAGDELRGVTISENGVYESTLGTTPLVAFTGTIHPSVSIKDNGDYQNETVTTGSPTLMRWPGYTYLAPSAAITATQGSGIKTGDIRVIVMTDDSYSCTVSVTNHRGGDPYVGTFNALDETWVLIWTGTEWEDLGTPTCTF